MEEEPGAKYSYSSIFSIGAHSVTKLEPLPDLNAVIDPEPLPDLNAAIDGFLEQFALEESLAKSRKRAP